MSDHLTRKSTRFSDRHDFGTFMEATSTRCTLGLRSSATDLQRCKHGVFSFFSLCPQRSPTRSSSRVGVWLPAGRPPSVDKRDPTLYVILGMFFRNVLLKGSYKRPVVSKLTSHLKPKTECSHYPVVSLRYAPEYGGISIDRAPDCAVHSPTLIGLPLRAVRGYGIVPPSHPNLSNFASHSFIESCQLQLHFLNKNGLSRNRRQSTKMLCFVPSVIRSHTFTCSGPRISCSTPYDIYQFHGTINMVTYPILIGNSSKN